MITAAPAIQRRFRFFDESRAAALARMDTAKFLLGCDEDHVLYLIHDKQLVAFDLAMPGSEKRVPGVWTRSIHTLQEHNNSARQSDLVFDDAATAEAIADLLPQKGMFGLTELKKILGVTAGHLHHLIEAGVLTGRGGDRVCKAPLITRASAERFLKERRIQ